MRNKRDVTYDAVVIVTSDRALIRFQVLFNQNPLSYAYPTLPGHLSGTAGNANLGHTQNVRTILILTLPSCRRVPLRVDCSHVISKAKDIPFLVVPPIVPDNPLSCRYSSYQ